MFNYIIDKVRQRTFLSPAGKEVLLKSVTMAMPVYSMSCFKLLTQVISKITNLISRFWWEKSNDKRGISWIAWSKLQCSKQDGGLGLWDLEKFNDALLAKQSWRLLKHPTTLFAKLFKAKYFKDSTIIQAKAQKEQSYGWYSILVGLQLFIIFFSPLRLKKIFISSLVQRMVIIQSAQDIV